MAKISAETLAKAFETLAKYENIPIKDLTANDRAAISTAELTIEIAAEG